MSETFYFTLGPVQRFVAQARRTRDLWSGSFLLSYLAGCAMVAVEKNDGAITVPDVSCDPLFSWITENTENISSQQVRGHRQRSCGIRSGCQSGCKKRLERNR